MASTRRRFFKKAVTAGGMWAMYPALRAFSDESDPVYKRLDRAAAQPVVKRELFPSPVVIDRDFIKKHKKVRG